MNEFTIAINSAAFKQMNKALENLAELQNIVSCFACGTVSDSDSLEKKAHKLIHDSQDTIWGLWQDTSYAKQYSYTGEPFCEFLYGRNAE